MLYFKNIFNHVLGQTMVTCEDIKYEKVHLPNEGQSACAYGRITRPLRKQALRF
jgi:hypothetical protein